MKIFTELPKDIEKVQNKDKEILTSAQRNKPLAKIAATGITTFEIRKPMEAIHADETGESKADIAYKNKIDGCRREDSVENELKDRYPESSGYKIIKEAYLRDQDGNIVKDPETGQARRIDFVVVKDGKVVDSVDVTSKTAPKDAQSAKEERIRENGGNYVKDPETGELIRMPDSVHTRIERRD